MKVVYFIGLNIICSTHPHYTSKLNAFANVYPNKTFDIYVLKYSVK